MSLPKNNYINDCIAIAKLIAIEFYDVTKCHTFNRVAFFLHKQSNS